MRTMREMKYDEYVEDGISGTLRNKSGNYGGGSEVLVIYTDTCGALCMDDYKGANKQYVEQGKLVITRRSVKDMEIYTSTKASFHTKFDNSDKAQTLVATDYKDPQTVTEIGGSMRTVVRRLTPRECERLQGFPDDWTDIGEWTDSKGKKRETSDTARYKALGNSICLPFWQFLARRIAAQYERDITMGSLFDGIGGFPLVFERVGGKAVWASEIEEFPIAVTKRRFPEEDVNELH